MNNDNNFARSDYFNGAISNRMMEADTGKITIRDHTKEIMKEVINFIYTGMIKNINEENAEDLFIAANKFLLEGMKDFCEQFLMSKVDLDNAIDLMILGSMCEAEKLKKAAKQVIVESCLSRY